MESLLYGVRPTGALTFGSTCALLGGAAALAHNGLYEPS